MEEPRRHGRPPWTVVAVHGGPGACGDLGSLAGRLGRRFGVLEPWCVAKSLEGQIAEVEAAVDAGPVERAILVGHSWGAWLVTLAALRRPERTAGVIWIGCPPFETAAAATILPTRLARLDDSERAEASSLMEHLTGDPNVDARAFSRLGRLFARADAWDPVEDAGSETAVRADVFRAVWPQGAALRDSGRLRAVLADLVRPVVAFHGTHDPHPIAAVVAAGAVVRSGFRLHRLTACGHVPWRERGAREAFETALEGEIERLIDSSVKTGGNGHRK